MPSPALAAVLKDFAAPRPSALKPFAGRPSASSGHQGIEPVPESAASPEMPAPALVDPVDIDAIVADAVAQAEAALAERLSKEHADILQAERDRHAEELTDIHARFGEEAGDRIIGVMTDMESRIVELSTSVTARILGSILTDDIRDRSIERLAGIIREAIDDDEAVRIRVRGSTSLYAALKSRLPQHKASQLDFAESPDFDLSVVIDDSMFETRLSEWSTALAETLL